MKDKSILLRLEEQGQEAPRVQLPGADVPAGDAAGRRYEIVGEIARGGVGVVYKGRDSDLGRDVAMKVLRDEHLDRPELVQRFVEEAQIGGQLQHPGIVPVFELGVHERRRPYFAMTLVKGRTLADLLGARKDPAASRRALLAHFAQACHTVAYAHSRGVIHRDLKPSNVMVGGFGEVQVVDWGFAKVLEKGGIADERRARRDVTVIATVRSAAEGSDSIAGSVMGTPAYMPPEQALGHVDDLTERADVFALGAILCEILTGTPPYTGEPEDVLTAAAHARLDDAYARLDACEADAELRKLARACLSPLPKDRPQSAREVAAAVSAHLAEAERRAHEARVRAAEAELQVEEQRRARRQTFTLAAAILAMVLLGGGGFLAVGLVQASRERERVGAYEAAVLEANAAGNDWTRALAAADRARGLAGEDAARRAEADQLHARIRSAFDAADHATTKAAKEEELLANLAEISLRRGDDFDAKRTDAAYAATLSDSAALANFDRKVELAAHFDAWTWLRRMYLADRDWRQLDAMARTLDPDQWRNDLRTAAAAKDLGALHDLASDPKALEQGARSLDMLGIALGESGDADAAFRLLGKAFERHPDDFWVNYHLGNYAHRISDPRARRFANVDLAVEHLTVAVALRPTSASAHASLGNALLDADGDRAAAAEFREALRLDPEFVDAHNNLGTILSDEGDIEGAIAHYREAIRLDPAYAGSHSNLGNSLLEKGEVDAALAEFREAVRLDPNLAGVHFNLGNGLDCKGDLDGAIEEYRETLRLDPEYPGVRTNLGVALQKKGDAGAAAALFREAVRLDPTDAKAHVNIGVGLLAKGDVDGAIAEFREALRVEPGLHLVRANLGTALLIKGDLDGAIEECRAAVRGSPHVAMAHASLGAALRMAGDIDGAIDAYREAARVDPQFAAAHRNLGELLEAKGDVDGAIAAFRTATRIEPESAMAAYALGGALGAKGDLDGAIASYRKAVRLDPDLAAAHASLGFVLHTKGDVDGAIAADREALRLDPGLAVAHSNLGIALKDRDLAAATAEFREAARLAPERVGLHANLANALAAQGDIEGALASVREAARLVPETRSMRQGHIALLRKLYQAGLPGVLQGGDPPDDAATCLGLAELCSYGERYGDAVRLFRKAFALDEELAAVHGHAAARAAVMAGAGSYAHAHAWLRAALGRESARTATHPKAVILTLRFWKRDGALADVDPAANDDMPENDRAAWKALWADVDATRARAEEVVAHAHREAVRINAARVEMRTKPR